MEPDLVTSAQQRLAEGAEEEQFRPVVTYSPGMVFRRSLGGRFLDVSAASSALDGRPCEEIVGSSLADWVHPADAEAFDAAERQLADSGRVTVRLRLRLLHGDGRWVWTEPTCWVVRNERGDPVEVRGFIQEVDGPFPQGAEGARSREETLRALQGQARSIIDTARDAFVSINQQGEVIDWNQSAENLFGWTRQEMLGRTLTETIIPERYHDSHVAGLQRVLAGGEPHVIGNQVEVTALHRNGRELPVELGVWRQESAAAGCFNAFIRDVTERKQAEQARMAVETERRHLLAQTIRSREQERTWLAAELHDGPIQRLTAIGYGFEEACLALENEGVEASRALFTQARRRLAEEIRGLRTLMAVLRPPALDEQGLAGALQDLADAFSRQHGVHCPVTVCLSQSLDPDIETVLYRVVQEALTNVARHARATNAAVSLTDSAYRAGSAELPDGTVVLTVTDDGVGFDATRVPEFVGGGHFGMASMRERVELASGTYNFSSSPGTGTRIKVFMPAGGDRQAMHGKEGQT
ncbi:PAS domain S-box protein [Streptomyces lunaelactis]|uniref:PAS domain-containing sensor histidine kinase n=1 Tax=Streptomyces lunaelactis TaxID=1535768 RepID=UPI0015859A63|nr:PAS domain S-box protein [Streptomyces lunaelactis]NUK01011.1 PAS domain S-box protein [Streptomyces lunaelactis]NUK16912.1 PAS domain S-box protein [Streptomyces lunaelactis]NUK35923.1 PAS domain S-box protein [Streptomyces lunaelactis]NUK42492.1 PAS domain S-box protein [Streptomyces lunaelactis]NUK53859.1 PAS domain S-box protein [Streptomyces lunaelactis]